MEVKPSRLFRGGFFDWFFGLKGEEERSRMGREEEMVIKCDRLIE